MFLAAIGSPLVARRVPPGIVVAATLALSTVGYVLLALVDASDGLTLMVVGFGLVYLGLGAIAALGTDLVVGAAPAEKAGSASAMSETVQELGLALGVAVLGSLATAVYRDRVDDTLPAGCPVRGGRRRGRQPRRRGLLGAADAHAAGSTTPRRRRPPG